MLERYLPYCHARGLAVGCDGVGCDGVDCDDIGRDGVDCDGVDCDGIDRDDAVCKPLLAPLTGEAPAMEAPLRDPFTPTAFSEPPSLPRIDGSLAR